ncbi:MAG: chemotaxis protein CheW [Xenococcaceae cyanobacterium MO_234.B1]|nr:chemotaxis protein CheW [Xenococcaceae cyanobacterium MO_234.B1]
MEEQSYLIFRLHNLLYGIQTSLVKEIFQLPEITPIPEAPPDIIGILNLRGAILPIMHLERRLGQPISGCSPTDRVIVLEWQMIQVGIVINEVLDVQTIPTTFIETEPNYGRETHINTAFISGIAKVADKTIILLNSEALIRHPNEVAMMVWETEANQEEQIVPETLQPDKILSNFYDLYCPQATIKQRDIFRQRAEELGKSLEDLSINATVPLAVFSLGEEYWAFDLEFVKEFIKIHHITPIPCCPNYIVGNINLRGQILTVVDLRPILQVDSGNPTDNTQIIVIEIDDIKAGVVVDEIFDVLYFEQNKISPTPTVVAGELKNYIKGTMPYEQTMLTRIDLVRILAEERLVVK